MTSATDVILIININPELEEDLVDYLLSLDFVHGFSSCPVKGHGAHEVLSLAEQVSGRKKRTRVEMLLPRSQADNVLAGLAANVGRDITWWMQPVLASGCID